MARQRRALSTIVGALLFLVVLVSAFGSILTAMSFMTTFQEKSIQVADANINQLNEIFSLNTKTSSSCVLTTNVENKGAIPINIVELFVVDTTSNSLTRYDVVNGLVSAGYTRNIADANSLSPATTVTLAANKNYQVKVVTERGTAQSKTLSTPSSCKTPALVGELVAAPPEIASNEEITVAFVVVNRGDETLYNVTLGGAPSYNMTVTPHSALKNQTLISNSTISELDPGETVVFRWSVILKGGIGTSILLDANATASNAETTGNEEAKIKITKEYQRDLVSQKLVAKPEVFIFHPAPFGESGGGSGKGVWGAIIVNPTDVPFSVSKLTFVLHSVTSESSEELATKDACGDDGISPDNDAEWSCPNENLVDWTDAAPLEPQVPARGAKAFIVKFNPGTTGAGGDDLASFLMSVTVHTTLGQFSKGNYASSMEGQSAGAITNIYLTDTTDESLADDDAHIFGTTSMSTSATNQVLNIAITDFNTSTAAYITSGGRLIVNLPAGFAYVSASGPKFSGITTITYPDDSTQIQATLAQNVGDASGAESAVLSITVNPPETGETRAYVMYCLTEGATTSSGLVVGATAEVPIIVTAP